MYLLGYSLNNLSLMALTIATGFVVDDAIVMIENIARYIEQGEPPFEAALKGAKQIGFTIVSLTVSLVAVLIPLLFMGGIIGRLFREFAVTLAVAIVVSALLSLTLTPMMSAHLLRREPKPKRARPASTRRSGARLRRDWSRSTIAACAGSSSTSGRRSSSTIATVALTRLPGLDRAEGLLPAAGHRPHRRRDRGDARRVVREDDGAPDAPRRTIVAEGSGRRERRVVHRRRRHEPDVEHRAPLDHAQAARRARSTAPTQIIARLSRSSRRAGRSTVHLQARAGSPDRRARRAARTFQYTLEDADPEELAVWAPSACWTSSSARPSSRTSRATRSRRASARRSPSIATRRAPRRVSTQAIDDTLYDAFGQRQISTIFTQLNLYRVILEVKPEFKEDATRPRAASTCATPTGDLVPLSAFAHVRAGARAA